MSSYYTQRNGLANFWGHDYNRMELAKWVYHNPEDIKNILESIINQQEEEPAYQDDEGNQVILEPMSPADVDRITGVYFVG